MEQIYALKLWGNNQSSFYSGEGSHLPELVEPYIQVVKDFLKSFQKPIVICDLGCGDFNIGKNLVPFAEKYIGVDIVEDLIEYNKEQYHERNLEFQCIDIANDELPPGDCVILRQVLQHLSNAEIKQIIPKLSNYKYVILTEHIPAGDFKPNQDIISGQGIRLKKQSGVVLTADPFNLRVKNEKQLLKIRLTQGKGEILTTLFTI